MAFLTTTDMTLGLAFLAGLRPHARCLRGKRMGPVKVEPCGYTAELHFETLLWKCGAAYPCWRLARFLKCPRCGGTRLTVDWLPGGSPAQRQSRDLVQCEDERLKAARAAPG